MSEGTEGRTMQRYHVKWAVEFEAEDDDHARQVLADLLDQSEAVEAMIFSGDPVYLDDGQEQP